MSDVKIPPQAAAKAAPANRTRTYPGEVYETIGDLKEFEEAVSKCHKKGWRLMTITAVDLKERIELIYHFDTGEHMHHIRFLVDPEVPHVSLLKMYPSAFLYENEIAELMGVKIQGIEGKLLLGKDMQGMHPLRKSFKVEEFIPKTTSGMGHPVRDATPADRLMGPQQNGEPDLSEGAVCVSDDGEVSTGSSDIKVDPKAKKSGKGGN